MEYGSSPYGASEYGGQIGGGGISHQIQKTATYATVPQPTRIITKSGRYGIGVTTTQALSSRYDVFLYPVSITKSASYIVLKPTTIPVPAQYAIKATKGAMSLPSQYVVIVPVEDDDDFSKEIIVASHQAVPYTIWKAATVGDGGTSMTIDVSQCSSIGFYLQVSAATVIDIQAQTADSLDHTGWTTYQSYTFDEAGSASFGIWFLPFTTMRLLVETGVTITAEIFLRT